MAQAREIISGLSVDDAYRITKAFAIYFELTNLAGISTTGVLKDVVMVGGYQSVEVDFTANNPGLTLFHCHQQLHMDFGFMTLFDYV